MFVFIFKYVSMHPGKDHFVESYYNAEDNVDGLFYPLPAWIDFYYDILDISGSKRNLKTEQTPLELDF